MHVLAAAYAWHLLPHGFPAAHPRFWVHEVGPAAFVAIGVACIVAVWRERERTAALAVAVFPGLYAGLAAGWVIVFPVTGAWVGWVAGITAVVLGTCCIAACGRRRARWLGIGAMLGALAGFSVARAERGADPATHPAEQARPVSPRTNGTLPDGVEVTHQAVRVRAGNVQIAVSPLLSFNSRSPDRGWTVFAPRTPHDDVHGAFSVTAPSDDVIHIDAETAVTDDVYSHLNAYCIVEVRGHRRLFVAFSAMPDKKIEITYSEYPTGKPSRFAYIDASSNIHVVEASTGEKGPFTELARGHSSAGAPLGLTFYDGDQPIASLELADFASQASTQLSPTAGWGVPENAIELSLRADRPDADAVLFVTLAATSVGRGWDSVGHAAGLYRDRIDIRRAAR